jgi:hypothetical protein
MTAHKDPSEQFAVSLDFAADLGSGNGIASIVSVTAGNDYTKEDSTSAVIALTPAPAIDGTAVVLSVTGGLPLEQHTILVLILASTGEIYDGQITLRIDEAPGTYTPGAVPAPIEVSPGYQINRVDADARIGLGPQWIIATAGDDGITLTLPAGADGAGPITITKSDSAVGKVIIAGTVNGDAAGYRLVNKDQFVTIDWDGADWRVKGNN